MAIQEGQLAPDFTLPDTNAQPTALQAFRGKHVVIYFYPKDNTPGCTKEACGFRDAHDQMKALGVEILGVSPDGSNSHKKFSEKFNLPFRLLTDADKKMMTDYDAYGEKMMYGKKTQGVIRSTVWVGPDGKVVKHWKRVAKAETHPEQVLEALKSQISP